MTVVPAQNTGGGGGGSSSSLYDVLELVLDRGLVIDAFVRVSLVGIELLKIDVRVVVASVDTYLRFAEAAGRLNLEAGPNKSQGLPEILENTVESGSKGKTKGALAGAAETLSDAVSQGRSRSEERSGEREKQPARRRSSSRAKEGDE
ncbi:gas vesicle protein GvpJ [Streptomyces sp. 184]|uniref:gas vesicle protein GvpJ n=1 Tax=Streptomyces sp. 184 TaxID=1827526 RepID=UPI0038923E29